MFPTFAILKGCGQGSPVAGLGLELVPRVWRTTAIFPETCILGSIGLSALSTVIAGVISSISTLRDPDWDVEVTGLHKRFGDFVALNGIELNIRRGEF
jgi:hypothetical protein